MKNLDRCGSIHVFCLQCGKEFVSPPSRIKNGRSKYCSRACSSAMKSEKYKGRKGVVRLGSDNPNWRGRRAKKTCPVCGNIFAKIGKTCSAICGQQLRIPLITGDNSTNHKNAKPPLKCICAHCQQVFTIRWHERKKRVYCSTACFYKHSTFSVQQVKLAQELESAGFHIEQEKSWDWLRSPYSNRIMRVDIFLPQHQTVIEYDGRQHYEEKAFNINADAFHKLQQRDAHKTKLLAEHNIRLIRLKRYPRRLSTLINKIAPHMNFQPDLWTS